MDSRSHLLYVLLDSNLPTGGFVASSGLESWAKHGFLSFDPDPAPSDVKWGAGGRPGVPADGGAGGHVDKDRQAYGRRQANPTGAAAGVTDFARAEIENYHSTTGGFVRGAWEAVSLYLKPFTAPAGSAGSADRRSDTKPHSDASVVGAPHTGLSETVQTLLALDKYHESSMLSHVSRRASKAQGVAMLTLYTKGLSAPPMSSMGYGEEEGSANEREAERARAARELVDEYKLLIRRGVAPGHLSVCWGIMAAALGIPLDQAMHLHLFLHARSLLSAAVRLNLIGPYLSSQLLLHPFKTIIDRAATSVVEIPCASSLLEQSACALTGGQAGGEAVQRGDRNVVQGKERRDGGEDAWAWQEEAESGPATTWPLGELLMARHDLQHSRIFNS